MCEEAYPETFSTSTLIPIEKKKHVNLELVQRDTDPFLYQVVHPKL